MGELYLAITGEAGQERVCVVKTVLAHSTDEAFIARFRDEAKVVVRLSHGNLVSVFDAGTLGGQPYLAMEHVEGRDLRTVWGRCVDRGAPIPVEIALYIAREVCRGLHYAHVWGGIQLVHRDVSPPNILLSTSGEVKLADFGLATSTIKMHQTQPGVIYGKLSYMSPEQMAADALDARSDIYSMGVVLWEMLAGRKLFQLSGNDLAANLERMRDRRVDPPSRAGRQLSPELDAVAMRALAPERDDRYQTADKMREALAAALIRLDPTMDASRLAALLRSLFGTEIDRERAERQRLVSRMRTPVEPLRDARVDPPSTATPVPGQPASEDSAAMLGEILAGRYQIKRMLGEGGMGRVYEARHVEIDKRVAVKVLHPVYSRMPEVVERFRREARAASKIGHANIVDVTDSGTTARGRVYFVMEFLEGMDLAEVLAREGKIPVDRMVRIASQACRALAAAHDVGIVHRDLKPENIFLTNREGAPDFVKILDFGVAISAEMMPSDRLTRPGMAMGTPEYMAPEQAAGKPADARVDVYALGAILYEGLCGKPPHEGENAMEVLHRKATQRPKDLRAMNPDVPEELAKVIMAAIEWRPEDRPQTMGQLGYALERCMYGRGAAVASLLGIALPEKGDRRRSDSVAAQVLTGAHRMPMRRATAWLAMGVAVAGIGVAVWGLMRRPEKETKIVVVAPPPAPVAQTVEPARPPPPPVVTPKVEAPPPPDPEAARMARGREMLRDGETALRAGRFDEAAGKLRGALQLGAPKGLAYTDLARVAFERGQFDEAIDNGQRALRAGGGDRARMLVANANFRKGNFEVAAEEYQRILKSDPGSAEAQRNLAAARRRLGK
jgi:serine/threonine protein kinase